MKKYFIVSLLSLMIFIAACGEAAVPSPETLSARPEGDGSGVGSNALVDVQPPDESEELPNITATPPPVLNDVDESYPAPIVPTPQPLPEGYEIEAGPLTISPYPGPVLERLPQPDVTFAVPAEGIETVWVEISSGVQCDSDGATYDDILAAIDLLSAEDVPVFDGATESRIVCAACGCPNSIFYRLNIESEDLETAVSLGFLEPTP